MVSTIVVKADAINDRRVVTKYLNVATLRTISSDNKPSRSTVMKSTIAMSGTDGISRWQKDKRVSVISFAGSLSVSRMCSAEEPPQRM